jgi:rhamnogalacturonan endolyase
MKKNPYLLLGIVVGAMPTLIGDGVISDRQIQGIWYEREVTFDPPLMNQGANVLKLIVAAGPINSGIIYDYVRLELDESALPVAMAGL